MCFTEDEASTIYILLPTGKFKNSGLSLSPTRSRKQLSHIKKSRQTADKDSKKQNSTEGIHENQRSYQHPDAQPLLLAVEFTREEGTGSRVSRQLCPNRSPLPFRTTQEKISQLIADCHHPHPPISHHSPLLFHCIAGRQSNHRLHSQPPFLSY